MVRAGRLITDGRYRESVDFQWGTGRVNPAIVSFLAGYQPRERLRLIDARPSIALAHILVWPNKTLEFGKSGMTVLSTNIRRVLCSAKESTVLRGSSQYTLRNHLTAMPWKAVIWDQNIVKSQFFHLGFVKFSLCCLPVSVDLSGATQWS